jgi:murein DD-endopeptidase MepM/ murein hydrolase activator NlpD
MSMEDNPAETSDKRHVVRDTAVAGAILLVSATAVGLYFHFSQRKEQSSESSPKPVVASSWLGVVGTASQSDAASKADATESTPVEPALEIDADLKPHAAGLGNPPAADSYLASQNTETFADNDKNVRHGKVASGVPVITSLQKLGLSLQQAHEIITALNGVYDFRKARPGETFELKVDETKKPLQFVYHVSLTEVYEVDRQGSALKGKRKFIPTTKKERRFGGTIATSMYKALSELGANPSLAGRIVEVLANEVNFYKEQRPGDTFRVLVQEESLNGTFLGYGPVLALEYRGVKSGKKRFFLLDAEGREPEYFNEKGISQPRSVIAIPLHYTRISSTFGIRFHPVLKRKKEHNGVDFAAGTGEPVWACQEGVITIAAKKGANGNLVGIRHAEDLESYYAHLSRFGPGIKVGVTVKKRQIIGYVGNTGRSTGPHLHFGLKKAGKFIDPLKYRVQPGRPVEAKYRKALDEILIGRGQLLDRTPITAASEPLAKAPDDKDNMLGDEEAW